MVTNPNEIPSTSLVVSMYRGISTSLSPGFTTIGAASFPTVIFATSAACAINNEEAGTAVAAIVTAAQKEIILVIFFIAFPFCS